MPKVTRARARNLAEIEESLWKKGGLVHASAEGAARAWSCSFDEPAVVFLPDSRQSQDFASDYKTIFPNKPVHLLNEVPLNGQSITSRPLLLQRGETIQRWGRDGGVLVVTPGAAMAPCLLGDGEFLIKKGEEYARDRLVAWLERSGYHRSELVWSPGQYILRGFIMDVFDPVHALPLRFEFFDETVEHIRAFRPSSQKSVTELEDIELHSVASARPATLTQLLQDNARIVLYEPQKLESQASSYHWLWNELCKEAGGEPVPEWGEFFVELAKYPRLRVSRGVDFCEAELDIEEVPSFKGEMKELLRYCDDLNHRGYTVEVISMNPRFLEKGGPLSELPFIEAREGTLSSGFIDRSAKKAILSDRELSGISSGTLAVSWRVPSEWRERLTSGQLVVHEDYGVAVFRGIEEIVSGGETLDAITLEFAENKRLLVPVLQFHKITPVPEHENDETLLDELKSSRWRKGMEKSRERAQEEARVLMELFARRELERRDPFPESGELYRDFVKAFPHEPTADQLKATAEIMEDLSSPFPMDRLVVGDVGFGKTEVAMRAAFRTVESGKQVCFLVPTTILAQQHYSTFISRTSGFPVKVGLLSRFVSKAKADRTLADAAEGAVDILIGTHKLLQKGIAFKNLGLLVIDEEHRFGVMHKEALKRAYGGVDILSLSATPIPRTLALSLRGLRSLSLLATPPEERQPVTTYAGPWQISLVRKAIAHELSRGGQVYFVSNRIGRMENQKVMLEAFFPDARIHIAHGQMPERQLESTMLDFYDGKIDILLCTTIIESGLDVGSANTLIVDDAQELGLAQMYQLRGRVGRRGESGFAYFFYPEKEELRRETADRLEAISTLTDLGSGYSLARRDLEIRGSGEIGGTTQHGNVKTGGFQFFYRMLEQEIAKLRGHELKQTELTYDQGGSIPAFYIPQDGVRVTLYRRLLKAVGLDELAALRQEMEDRFGPMPEAVRYLADLTAIRNCGGLLGLKSVNVARGEIQIKGVTESLGAVLKKKRGWMVLGESAVGPGGPQGAKSLVETMQEV